jgi:hypothetical protein
LSNSCSNSGDDQASVNVGGDDGGGGGYNKDIDTEDWALWDENDHDFRMITSRASPGYKPPQNGQMPISPHVLYAIFSTTLFEVIAAETNRYVSKKTCIT